MKLLHLSFHKGCINDIDFICKQLSIECEVLSHVLEWNTNKTIDTLAEPSNQHYNVTKERALKYWERYKDYFELFDCILTSDTAPLSRIFLQNNNWNKKLIIWICNRFDYCHQDQYCINFPDKEYYELFRNALENPNVKIFGYTQFELEFCKKFNIFIKSDVIKPSGGLSNIYLTQNEFIDLKDTWFIVPYHNETILMDLSTHLKKMGIKNECKKYNGPVELLNYRGIIHIPYNLSNLALFEIFQLGLIYFIPSFDFLNQLSKNNNFWFANKDLAFKNHYLIEWYNPEYCDLFIFFNNWNDLKEKLYNTNYYLQQKKILEFGQKHLSKTLKQWEMAFFS